MSLDEPDGSRHLERILKTATDPEGVLFDFMEETEENFAELSTDIDFIKTVVEDAIENKIDGKDGQKGEKGDKGDLGITGPMGPQGPAGTDGKNGRDGKDGEDGLDGLPGSQGAPGKDGEKGDKGDIPKHEWNETWLRFENPDGSWGPFTNLQGPQGMSHRDLNVAGFAIAIKNDGTLISQDTSSINFVGATVTRQGQGVTVTVNADAVTSVNGQAGVVVLTTTDIAEGANLYYTQARFNTAFTAKSTTDLTEGTNKYYTDARVRAAISETITGIDYSSSTGVFSLTSGYVIPTTTEESNWNTAYSWGDHAIAGYLVASNNLSDVTNAGTARTNLGLVAGGAGDIWVEKAGDTMTSTLTINPSTDVSALVMQENAAAPTSSIFVVKRSDGTVKWNFNKTNLSTVGAIGITLDFDTANGTATTSSRNGLNLNMLAGYTGSSFTNGLSVDNQIAGTDATYTGDTSTGFNYRVGGNRALTFFSRATTTGVDVGLMGGSGKANTNYAGWLTTTTSKTSAINVALLAVSQQANGGAGYSEIAGAFVLGSANSAPPVASLGGVVLLVDNWLRTTAKILQARQASADVFVLAANGVLTATPTAVSTGTQVSFTFTPPANTGMTASTEVSQFIVSASTQTWAAGTIATQRYARFDAMTVAFASTSTVTEAIGVDMAQPVAGTNATITRGYALRTADVHLNGGQRHKYTATATDYTVLSTDFIIGVTSTASARTITLPSATTVAAGKTYRVKDESGAAGTNNITVSASAGNIDGAASVTIATNYGSKDFYSNGTNWFVI
jgi:hypothetical protein